MSNPAGVRRSVVEKNKEKDLVFLIEYRVKIEPTMELNIAAIMDVVTEYGSGKIIATTVEDSINE